ncbi:hypothetical protein Godav_029531 [Gossypium davidsonii]|uniref:Sulfotransferase n=1 Tax=Gossypium davidsonii TaxID=34287 RepID=A0A7J8TJF4_GOSDV|nr:hypothetical protein [Gossypium davidsonii]
MHSSGIRGSMLIHDHFKPRSTDIIVATSPKCGTTWLRAFVFSISNRASFDFSDHPLRKTNPQDLVPFFEAIIHKDGSTSFVDGIPSLAFFQLTFLTLCSQHAWPMIPQLAVLYTSIGTPKMFSF